MDSKQRVIAAFERRPTDRPPIFPVVTLVHAAKLIGKSISEIGLEPRLAYDALYKAWEVYGFDGFEIPALDEFPLFAEKLHPLWENETLYFVDDAQNKCYYFQDLNDQPIKLNNRVYSYEEIFAQPVRSCEELLDGGFMDPVRDLIQRVDGRAYAMRLIRKCSKMCGKYIWTLALAILRKDRRSSIQDIIRWKRIAVLPLTETGWNLSTHSAKRL